jgi:hypothetical protein
MPPRSGVNFNSLCEEQEPTAHLKECLTALTNYLVDEIPGRNFLGLRFRNTENVQDNVVGINLRRHDQFKPDVVSTCLGRLFRAMLGLA